MMHRNTGRIFFLAVLAISKRPVHQDGLSPVHQGRACAILSRAEAPPERAGLPARPSTSKAVERSTYHDNLYACTRDTRTRSIEEKNGKSLRARLGTNSRNTSTTNCLAAIEGLRRPPRLRPPAIESGDRSSLPPATASAKRPVG
jgi:hypothetical protein